MSVNHYNWDNFDVELAVSFAGFDRNSKLIDVDSAWFSDITTSPLFRGVTLLCILGFVTSRCIYGFMMSLCLSGILK